MPVYVDMIDAVARILEKCLEGRAPQAPEGKRRRFARGLATMLVLSAEWGAGDALAGYYLRQYDAKVVENVHKSLEALGVKHLPRPRAHRVEMYFWDLMRQADFGDEEVNSMLRELDRLGVSGGRYRPSFLKKGEE